jgi:hypothetical protein
MNEDKIGLTCSTRLYKILVEKLKRIIYLEILVIDARITLEWILTRVEDSEIYSFGSGERPVIVSCEDCDYPSISIKEGEFRG